MTSPQTQEGMKAFPVCIIRILAPLVEDVLTHHVKVVRLP